MPVPAFGALGEPKDGAEPVLLTSGGAVVSVSPAPPPLNVRTLDPPVESPKDVFSFMLDSLDPPLFTVGVTAADVLAGPEFTPESGPEAAPAMSVFVMAVIPEYPLPNPVGNVPVYVAFIEERMARTLDGIGAMVVLRLVMQMLGRRSSMMAKPVSKARLHQ